MRDDWFALSETNNVADEVMVADLKATALYAVLKEVMGDEGNREAYLDVAQLIDEPLSEGANDGVEGEPGSATRKLLEARFTDAPDHFISLLMEDYAKEKATVGAFLDDSDLPRLAVELAGHAAQEVELEGEEVTMDGGVQGSVEGEGEDSMMD